MAKASHKTKERYFKSLVAFGKNLRRIREQKMTQEQLAFEAGISLTTITNLETGRLNCTLATLLAIAHALRVDPSELLKDL